MRSLSSASRLCAAPTRLPASQRLLAAPRAQSNDEKPPSWGDMAKGVVKKLSDGVGSFLGLKPSDDKRKPAPAPPQYDPRLPSPPGLIGGLLGRAAGSLLGAAVQTLAKEAGKMEQQRSAVMERVVPALQSSPQLQRRLGGSVSVGAVPLSQSTSSMNINGQVTQSINLVLPISGADGRMAMAQASQVSYTSGPGGRDSCSINVQMPEGDVVRVQEGGGGGGRGSSSSSSSAGRVIDVDYTIK